MRTRRFLVSTLIATALGMVSTFPVSAQSNSTSADRTTVRTEEGRDWGWLGLLGLAGLAGLVRRDRHDPNDIAVRPSQR